jgi:hypothetical protein
MSCEEYRQALTADPAWTDETGHVAVCADCQAFTRKLQSLNLDIDRAMQIDGPELAMPDLPDVDAARVTTLPSRGRSWAPLWFAAAATVVLAASISLRMSGLFVTYDSLAEEVLAHLDHEPMSLRVTDVPVSNERLQRALPATVAALDRERALVTYANPCIINGHRVPHLVVQGQHGPVTILLMPEERVAEAIPLEGEGVHGMIVPTGDGSIAIIANRDEPLDLLRRNVIESITWTT